MFIDDSRIIDVSTTPGPPSDATGVDVGRLGTEAIAYRPEEKAHRLAHPRPVAGCPFPGCDLGDEPPADRSAEVAWWRQAVGA